MGRCLDEIVKEWDMAALADAWEAGTAAEARRVGGIRVPPPDATEALLAEMTIDEGVLTPNPKPRRQDPLPPYETLFEIGFPTPKARALQRMRATDPRYFRSEYVLRDEWPLGWLAWNHSFHVPRMVHGVTGGVKWADLVVKLRDHRFHPDKEFGYVKHDATWEIIRIK